MNARDIANGWAGKGPYTKRRPGLIRAVLIAVASFAIGRWLAAQGF